MNNFYSAIGFLTIIRVPDSDQKTTGASILFFPIVGLILGGLLVGMDFVGSLFLSNELRALLDVLFLAVISGGLHLDGLADSADGFFSHKDKARILEIMRDSRMGPMGGIALIFCLLFKVAGISEIEFLPGWTILLIAPATSRFALVAGLVFIKNARNTESLGANLYQKGNYNLMVMGIIPAMILFIWSPVSAIFVLGIAFITIYSIIKYFHKKIGGITGDALGALLETTETITFITGGIACQHLL
ncbi:MAG: adenosylcobinamide-GDP ribazoletransferase [Nitrospinales bacterium]